MPTSQQSGRLEELFRSEGREVGARDELNEPLEAGALRLVHGSVGNGWSVASARLAKMPYATPPSDAARIRIPAATTQIDAARGIAMARKRMPSTMPMRPANMPRPVNPGPDRSSNIRLFYQPAARND